MTVVWSELEHNYGDASDIPELLRGCASQDAEVAGRALYEVSNNLYHQGGWVCSAASAALPFLIDLAAGGAAHHRPHVVEVIGRLAREAVAVEPRFVDPAWQPALDAMRPRLLALLDDPDPEVRREATLMLSDGVRHPESVEALRRRWSAETDRTTRCDLVRAFGVVLTWAPDESLRAELVALLSGDDLQLCLAAVHALAESDPAVAPPHVDMLVRAVLDPDAALWRDSAWIGGALVRTTGDLLAVDPVAATAFAIGISQDREVDGRVASLGQAGSVLSEWRTATGAILPLVGRRLHDDTPEVRYRAAALLACLGLDAKPYADHLAALAADPAIRNSRRVTTVGDAAVWALARQDDPRCLPGLVERLSGDRLGFGTAGAYHGRLPHLIMQPAIHEVLIPLRRHVDVLLDAVTARLATAREDDVLGWTLCDVVAAWGPAAEAALPAVARLLHGERSLPRAAKAIGAIGPPAADAAKALRNNTTEPTAAWALWRTGADPDFGIETLVHHVAEGRGYHNAIALLAELGPQAAASTDHLRDLTRSDNDWTRVEAAHALWRVTEDPTAPITTLTDLAEPLSTGDCLPVRIAALRYLADIGASTERVTTLARAILDNPRRIAYSGGWHTFAEDEEIRAAATRLLS
ncbi:HEAT repeat protein [Saccharothrix ecbatanensis]|uniref:HEAT repeat protein n=1 Tax=Saccharothrix ecbatanensis TaxID=1105145 RepID=A0A7W9HEB0_9PSEU|nr:HEAT repeat domain-containing protein [Saccharothrix ecbatanensis]MBB5800363.1 HEAT repeat protein [Saccharothrix ecbatanensis]